jgi:hypothetical protein
MHEVVVWVRKAHDAAPPQAEPVDNGDTPESLRLRVFQAVQYVNRHAGELPGAAVVDVRRLTDTLGEVIDTSDVRPLDVYAVISVRKTLEDYLPTTLHGYLALADNLRDKPAQSGRTPSQSLLEQIDALQTSASSVLVAARNQDVDALMIQGSFLQTKFSGSDLDL